MKKILIAAVSVAALSLTAVSAEAGGWGHHRGGEFHSTTSNHGNFGQSSGLVNVSPSLGLGDISLLNGLSVLNGSPIASGNVLSGILSGNRTGIGNGILGNVSLGILGGGNRTSIRRSSRGHHRW